MPFSWDERFVLRPIDEEEIGMAQKEAAPMVPISTLAGLSTAVARRLRVVRLSDMD